MYLFDLTKINCSIYLIVKSLYHIIGLCNIKYFICDPVSVTKKKVLFKKTADFTHTTFLKSFELCLVVILG